MKNGIPKHLKQKLINFVYPDIFYSTFDLGFLEGHFTTSIMSKTPPDHCLEKFEITFSFVKQSKAKQSETSNTNMHNTLILIWNSTEGLLIQPYNHGK